MSAALLSVPSVNEPLRSTPDGIRRRTPVSRVAVLRTAPGAISNLIRRKTNEELGRDCNKANNVSDTLQPFTQYGVTQMCITAQLLSDQPHTA